MTNRPLVLDTNIVLDLFVFDDAAALPLRRALDGGVVKWLATAPMRDELERVLAYPQIAARLAFHRIEAGTVLAAFDRHARLVDVPAKACVTCKDADDQKFIDVAVAWQAVLLSKDQAVLSMKKRLLLLQVVAAAAIPGF